MSSACPRVYTRDLGLSPSNTLIYLKLAELDSLEANLAGALSNMESHHRSSTNLSPALLALMDLCLEQKQSNPALSDLMAHIAFGYTAAQQQSHRQNQEPL